MSQRIATITNATASGETALERLAALKDRTGAKFRFVLNCTSITGTSPTMDLDLVAEMDGADYTLGSFTQVTAAGAQSIVVEAPPLFVKVVYTAGGTVTDFDATVDLVNGRNQ